MADDTLSPVGFDRPFIKAYIAAEQRFALACVAGESNATETDTVRRLVALGLEALGWSEERSIQEYAQYRVRCLKRNEPNEFEGR